MFRIAKSLAVVAAPVMLLAAVTASYAADVAFNQTTNFVTYATEVFGADADDSSGVLLDAAGMNVTLTVRDGTGVDAGNSGVIRFSLSDGMFGRNITMDDLSFVSANATSPAMVTISVMNNTGVAGDDRVSFEVAVADQAVGPGDTFTFTVPSISGVGALRGAGASIEVDVRTTEVSTADGTDGFQSGTIAASSDDDFGELIGDRIVRSVRGLVLELADGARSSIDIADPTRFIGEANVAANNDAAPDVVALELGTFNLTRVEGTQLDRAAGMDSEDLDFAAADALNFTVTGVFNANDRVFVDLDNDNYADRDERFDINFSGDRATLQMNGSDIPDGASVSGTIYYLPCDVEPDSREGSCMDLRSATFVTMVDYVYGADRSDYLALGPASTMVATALSNDDIKLDQTTRMVTYASELFGPDSSATQLQASGMNVTLTVRQDTSVDAGSSGSIRFELSDGATFGAEVGVDDLAFHNDGGGTEDNIVTRILDGGAAGDASVTFGVEVLSGVITGNDAFNFSIRSISNAAALADPDEEIEVTVSTALITHISTGHNFRTGVIGADDNRVGAVVGGGKVVAASARGINLTLGEGVVPLVNLENRTRFGGVSNVNLDDQPGNDAVALTLARLSLEALDGDQYTEAAAGTDIALEAGNSLTLSVVGNFNSDDAVFADLNGDGDIDLNEGLTITGGRAERRFSGDIAAPADNAVNLYYVPGGTMELTPTIFEVEAMYAFRAVGYRALTGMLAVNTLDAFANLSQDGWALAIPRSGGSDIVNVRVTNETDDMVTVFARGRGENGTNLGFLALFTLRGNETRVIQSGGMNSFESFFCGIDGTDGMDDMDDMDDMDMECWTGRARFDFFADGNISVQSFQRGNMRNLRNAVPSTGIEVNADNMLVR